MANPKPFFLSLFVVKYVFVFCYNSSFEHLSGHLMFKRNCGHQCTNTASELFLISNFHYVLNIIFFVGKIETNEMQQ